ncbi:MAG: tetratricopeptide repeat protein [Clostridia bacterium]|nr:tetratricopeptide repeat protein [Clostridia bacterium]
MFELVKAKKALSKGKNEKAEKHFEKMLKNPNEEGLVLYAYHLIRSYRPEKALKLFDEEILPFFEENKKKLEGKMNVKNKGSLQRKINASEINIYTNYAVALWQNNDLEKAIAVTEELFSRYKTTLIYGNLAFFYILVQNKEKALELSLQGYEFAPDDATVLDNLGYAYYMNGNYEESEKIYKVLMEKKPTFPDAYSNYSVVLIALGKTAEAKEMLGKCLRCNFTALTMTKKDDVEKLYNSL